MSLLLLAEGAEERDAREALERLANIVGRKPLFEVVSTTSPFGATKFVEVSLAVSLPSSKHDVQPINTILDDQPPL
jgi:hypothetical protein